MNQITNKEILKIKTMSDTEFEFHFEREIKLETRQQLMVIYYMREADARRIWAEAGYPSLAQYCRDKFKMSDTDIYRKIEIMRTLRDLPDLEEKLLEGSINTTTISKVNLFLKQKQKLDNQRTSTQEKRELLSQMEGLAQKTVEKELAKRSPVQLLPDQKKLISSNQIRHQFTSDVALNEKFERLKSLLIHSLPKNPNQNELLHKICDLALEKVDPLNKEARKLKRGVKKLNKKSFQVSPSVIKQADDQIFGPSPSMVKRRVQKSRSYQSVHLKRFIWQRDHGACTYVNPITQQKCNSTFGLEVDHIFPFGKGGASTKENLRLLCQSHNQLHAIRDFGLLKMGKYLSHLK